MKKVVFAALGAALLTGTVMAAPSAQAATAKNGVCESGEVCLYFNSDHQGSLADFSGSVRTYGTGAGCTKTIIYLHTNPLDGLRVGQHVDRGQRIATEAARGASAAHTHVEMRPGRSELAAPSVGDPT